MLLVCYGKDKEFITFFSHSWHEIFIDFPPTVLSQVLYKGLFTTFQYNNFDTTTLSYNLFTTITKIVLLLFFLCVCCCENLLILVKTIQTPLLVFLYLHISFCFFFLLPVVHLSSSFCNRQLSWMLTISLCIYEWIYFLILVCVTLFYHFPSWLIFFHHPP